MNEEQWKVVRDLRAAGYAVCIFNPDELRGLRADRVEDVITERGNDYIAMWTTVDEDEDE